MQQLFFRKFEDATTDEPCDLLSCYGYQPPSELRPGENKIGYSNPATFAYQLEFGPLSPSPLWGFGLCGS